MIAEVWGMNFFLDLARTIFALAVTLGIIGFAAWASRRYLPQLLAPHGVAVLELGQGQQAAVEALGRAAGLTPEACRADLGGVPRALVLRAA